MKWNISDLLDDFPEHSVSIPPDEQTSAQRIQEATLAKISNTAPAKKRKFSARRLVSVLAAAVVLTLSVTGMAVADILPLNIVQTLFGPERGSNPDGVVEYDDQGKLKTNIPAWERVEVDETLAGQLLAPYLTTTDETASYQGYTLALEANLYDPATGCGLAYYTLENPDGITGYQVFDNGELWFDNQTVFTRTDCADRLYLDSTQSTNTKLCICAYYIEQEPLHNLQLQLGAFVPVPEGQGEGLYGEVQDTLSIPLPNAELPAIQAVSKSISVTLSPIGISLTSKTSLDGTINYLALEYADGSRYVIRDQNGFLDNTCYSLLSSDLTQISLSFNRLVDTNQVEKVIVDGTEIPL